MNVKCVITIENIEGFNTLKCRLSDICTKSCPKNFSKEYTLFALNNEDRTKVINAILSKCYFDGFIEYDGNKERIKYCSFEDLHPMQGQCTLVVRDYE